MPMPELNNAIGETRTEQRKWRRITIAVVFFCFFVGLIVATQYFARLCNYDAALGFNVSGWYFPGMIIVWIVKWFSVPNLTEPLRLSAILGALTPAAARLF